MRTLSLSMADFPPFGMVERRDTGPAHLDRTADGYHVTSQQLANEEAKQRAVYDASDLAEELDEVIVQLLKEGDALEAGLLLTQRMNATISHRAALVVSE